MNFIKRTIYPVGQGAFFAETLFEKMTFVYDCGSNDKDALISSINDFCDNDLLDDVDGLFISHFHKDHISGIESLIGELKTKKRKIKRIFLPKLTQEMKINNLLRLASFGTNFDTNQSIINLINEPIEYLTSSETGFENVKIIQIRNEFDENGDEQSQEIVELTDSDSNTTTTYNSRTIFKVTAKNQNNISWSYIPFNYEEFVPTEITNFLNANNLTVDDFKNINHNKWQKISNAAASRGLNRNESSMVVLSSFQKGGLSEFFSALYLGDYPTKNFKYLTKLVDFIKSKSNSCCGLVQISHHGSGADFTNNAVDNFYKYFCNICTTFFINYGTTNNYGHPSCDIFNKLSPYGIFQITEFPKTKLVLVQ